MGITRFIPRLSPACEQNFSYIFTCAGDSLGTRLGDSLGTRLGDSLGTRLGDSLGTRLGDSLGTRLGDSLGVRLGDSLGMRLGDHSIKYPKSLRIERHICTHRILGLQYQSEDSNFSMTASHLIRLVPFPDHPCHGTGICFLADLGKSGDGVAERDVQSSVVLGEQGVRVEVNQLGNGGECGRHGEAVLSTGVDDSD